MKYFIAFLLFLSSCGTTGHLVFYHFDADKYDVEKEILNVINKDSAYTVPQKWVEHTKGDYFERIYIYFKKNPEELYQIGFTGDSSDWKHSTTSRLGLISVYQGEQFKYEDELSNREINRIENRFETDILSKIKYTYYKSQH